MKSYNVKFMYVSWSDVFYSDRIDFSSLEEAQIFINKIKKREDAKKICYIYLTTTEKIL